MDLESLKLAWKKSSAAAILFSPGKTGEQNIALVRQLAADASARYPQLMDVRFVPIALPALRLETWTYLMAAECVRQWRTVEVDKLEIGTFLVELGITNRFGTSPLLDALNQVGDETPLIKGLEDRIQALLQQHSNPENKPAVPSRTWLEQESTHLANWFLGRSTSESILSPSPEQMGGCIVQLQLYAPTIQSKMALKLKVCLAQLKHSGSQEVLNWINQLSQALQSVRADYEELRQNNLYKENAAWRAYDTLISQSQPQERFFFGQDRLDWKAALRALQLAYTCKLEAETYGLAHQMVDDLIQQTHRYTAVVAQADELLLNLQTWYLENCPSDSALPSLLSGFLAERINPIELRQNLELWVGQPIEQWGTANTTQHEELRAEILARIRPLCLEVYGECCTTLALAASQPVT